MQEKLEKTMRHLLQVNIFQKIAFAYTFRTSIYTEILSYTIIWYKCK